MTFDTFLSQAWNDHALDSAKVATRLHEGTALIKQGDQIPSLAHLATHVWGEHLGRWQDGVDYLRSLRSLPCFAGNREAEQAVARSIAILELAEGSDVVIQNFSRSEQIRILATAAGALSHQGNAERARKCFAIALEEAQLGLTKDDPAARALAVTGNNLACALEEKSSRTSEEMELMLLAAEVGRKYWEVAGTWLEVERAEYRLAMSFLKASRLAQALEHAQTCLEIVQENKAPTIEQFFAYEVLAVVERARGNEIGFSKALEHVKAQFEKIEKEEDRAWCRESLDKLTS